MSALLAGSTLRYTKNTADLYLRPEEVNDAVHVGLREGQLDAAVAQEGRAALSEGHLPPLVVLRVRSRLHLVVETVLDVERLTR